jgi:hypothetical protein
MAAHYDDLIRRQTEGIEKAADALEHLAAFFDSVTWAWQQADEETEGASDDTDLQT